jgi:hypothetical protein
MAFDSLQVPATIINNDKLISMAGNLMAKEKFDQDKREAGFVNQMAKIDSSGLRQGDVNKFKTKYNELINYGSTADLESIEGQTEVAKRLNELNAFVNISKAAKEQYDVPLSKMRFEKDFDPKNSSYIDKIIATPTDELSSIDFTKLKRIDDQDYELDIKKGFASKSVIEEIGNITYKNTANLMPKIVAAADNYINAISNTETGRKAIEKFLTRNQNILKDKTPEEIQKAYRDDIVGYFIGVADQSKTTGTSKQENYFDQFGIKPYQVATAVERGSLLQRMHNGDDAAWDMYMKFLPEGSKVDRRIDADIIKRAEYNTDGTLVTQKINGKDVPKFREFVIPKKSGFFDYAFNLNGLLETSGTKRGYADVNYEILKPVMSKFFEDKKYNAKLPAYYPRKTATSTKTTTATTNPTAPILGDVGFKPVK